MRRVCLITYQDENLRCSSSTNKAIIQFPMDGALVGAAGSHNSVPTKCSKMKENTTLKSLYVLEYPKLVVTVGPQFC